MQSLITLQCLCGVLLLFIAIASPHKLRHSPSISKITIESVTEPAQHIQNPHWDHRTKKLYYVQPMAKKLCCLDPATGKVTYADIATGGPGPTVPVEHEPHTFVGTAGTSFVKISWNPKKNSSNPNIEVLGTIDQDKNGTHFEDGKCDSRGRLWAGTMGAENPKTMTGVDVNQGSVYRLTCGPVITKEISPVNVSNGMAWSNDDKTFYYIDTGTRQVAAYDYNADDGTICNKRIAYNFPTEDILRGHPDGMTIDRDGNLWIALFNGGTIISVDPKQGKLLRTVSVPAEKPINCAWGGDKLDIMYVLTSRWGMTSAELEKSPKSGTILAIKGLGVRGLPAHPFSLHGDNCCEKTFA